MLFISYWLTSETDSLLIPLGSSLAVPLAQQEKCLTKYDLRDRNYGSHQTDSLDHAHNYSGRQMISQM